MEKIGKQGSCSAKSSDSFCRHQRHRHEGIAEVLLNLGYGISGSDVQVSDTTSGCSS